MDASYIRSIENTMMCLATFSRSINSFYALSDNLQYLDYGTGNLVPYQNICNALISDAAINWCKVFGSNNESTHWKYSIDDHEDFRSILFDEIGLTNAEFTAYWKKMIDFRSNIIAHFNYDFFLEGSTPEFYTAIAAACSAHKYLRKHLPAGVNYTGPTDLKVYGQDVGRAVLNKIIL
ncbi:TPA: hypothetical protein ACHBXG_004834 [Klebsiella pneumoniae]